MKNTIIRAAGVLLAASMIFGLPQSLSLIIAIILMVAVQMAVR